MLSVSNLSKSFRLEALFEEVNFTLNSGERLALIGPNGCGKSTLLNILAGREQADTGAYHWDPPELRMGYLTQGFDFSADETLQAYLDRVGGRIEQISARIESLAGVLALHPERADLQTEYDRLLADLQSADELAVRAPGILAGLGLGEISPALPAANLSGGQKTRLALAGVLLGDPQALLLDEPTNHLDLEMLAWLEDWLTSPPIAQRCGVLLVSHDRVFIDRVATGILELDPRTRRLKAYPGAYSAYLEQKEIELEKQYSAFSDQQVEIARLKGTAMHLRGLAQFRKGGKADTNDTMAKGFFANRGKGALNRAKGIERRLEHLTTDEHIEKPQASWQMRMDFAETTAGSRDVLGLEDLSIGYGSHVLLAGLTQVLRQRARATLVGPNGTGKTTLLRTIQGSIPPLAGRVRLGPSILPGFMSQEQEELDRGLTALESIRAVRPSSETDARTYLHKYLFSGDEVFTPVSRLSYGERARLSLACLTARGCNLLLLDEPLNHLDIPSRARFEQSLADFGGTILVVTHDRYFIAAFASEIWTIADGTIRRAAK
jgi:ATP-binding cassette subfamily F protein 3